uniref:Uncharacterized protein n=1 Tax=Chromera velia CCMP2878 TaxID=1169474 RepID=A0A0K6S8T3_9ALVE|eukprot:Cvel_25316.t1-p1 / transcript=Cvel_25316.t1 / gene=Cvel_25316 / organism=Chromera_velia_CCMP2878 / gene_product=hypothetical protein / transcript_product=hypothetical protein / location=Cvel_scaffold2850:16602-17637(+) / protein_length=114 / sequence_SO=supercontig / SO=protein_coding / is_pseudo=false
MFGRLLAGGEISMRHEAKSLDEWLRTFRSAALRGALTLGRGEAPRNGVAEKAYELFKNCRASVPQAKEGRTVKMRLQCQGTCRTKKGARKEFGALSHKVLSSLPEAALIHVPSC